MRTKSILEEERKNAQNGGVHGKLEGAIGCTEQTAA